MQVLFSGGGDCCKSFRISGISDYGGSQIFNRVSQQKMNIYRTTRLHIPKDRALRSDGLDVVISNRVILYLRTDSMSEIHE